MLKSALRLLICTVFFLGGIGHFLLAEDFAGIVPPILPWPLLIVWLTGLLELLLVIGILWPVQRRMAGKLAALYCLLVLPANIYQALSDVPIFGGPVSPELLWLRIPLQFVLIAAILWSTNDSSKTLIHEPSRDV